MKNEKWHRHLGVYGVCINAKNEMLVIIKNGGPYTGLFDLPGGSFENPESISECLKREIFEETKMNINILDSFGVFDVLTDSPYNGYNYTHHIVMIYSVVIINQSEEEINKYLCDNNKIIENDSLGYKWISIKKLNETNSSPLIVQACEIMNHNKNFEIINFYCNKKT